MTSEDERHYREQARLGAFLRQKQPESKLPDPDEVYAHRAADIAAAKAVRPS
jgi:hypothetical protein